MIFLLKILNLCNEFKIIFVISQTKPNIYLAHEVFEKDNSWAIIPILIDIRNQLITSKTKWFVLCETNSVINFQKLLSSLSAEDETKVNYCNNIGLSKP